MSDILKQAQYALDHWKLTTGHKVLIRSLMDEVKQLQRANNSLAMDNIQFMDIIDMLRTLEPWVLQGTKLEAALQKLDKEEK